MTILSPARDRSVASSEVYPACLRPSPTRSCKKNRILILVSTRTPLSAKSGLPCNLSMLDLRCISASHPTKVHVLRTWPKLLSPLLVLSPTNHRICLSLSFCQQEKLAASKPDQASELSVCSQNSTTLAAVNFLELRALSHKSTKVVTRHATH